MKKVLLCCFILCITLGIFSNTNAQELIFDTITIEKAQVLEILDQHTKNVPGTDVDSIYQTLQVELLSGPESGKTITIENDHLNLEKGDIFYLRHTVNIAEGIDAYSVMDADRMPVLYFFVGLFVLCVFIFGGKQGIRGLLALIGSFAFIVYILLPGITRGYSPILISVLVSSLIIVLGSYITHGFNKVTSSAVIGMIITILCTGGLAFAAIHFGKLTGFSSDEAVFLNLNTGGSIDFAGLLLGGILIGLLGVLYDAAIGQAVSVDELRHVGPHLSRGHIFRRATRIGREHIGALVNTLAIAYVGASLPLLLLFYNSSASLTLTINQEIFATEIIRTMIGSIGLILAVPITTFISVTLLVKPQITHDPSLKETEEGIVKRYTHSH